MRTAKLPSELQNKKNKPVKLRIGKPIPPSELEQFTDNESLCLYLRQKTYILAHSFESPKTALDTAKNKLKLPEKPPKPIIKAVATDKIEKEFEFLKNADRKLFSLNNFEVYFTKTKEIPNILQEIGRLREITFREVGEGTNNAHRCRLF